MHSSRTLRSLAVGLLGAAMAVSAMAQETVRVGLLFSYSGISGMAGKVDDNLVEMFQKLHGSEPGGKKVVFIRRDTTGPNPEVARRMAQELIAREKVQVIIGPDFTPNVLAMAPLVTQAKVPSIIMGAATQSIVGEKSPYYARTFFSIPQVVRPAAQWAAKNGMKKMAVVIADYAPGHDAASTFAKEFTDQGGQVTATIKVPVHNPEFSGYMQRIKDAKADGVFAFMPIGELSLGFLKAYADAGLKDGKLKLVATGDVTDESTLSAAGDSAVGVISVFPYSDAHDSEVNKKFIADYQKAYGKEPRISFGNVAVWDGLTLLYAGLEAQRGQKFDPDKFMAAIKGRKFESPRGHFTLDKKTGDIIQNVYVRRVERHDGLLQNVEFDTIPDVPPK